jgi:hypothetical protein
VAGVEQLKAEVRRYVRGEIHVEDLEAWMFSAEALNAHPPPEFEALASRVDLLIHQHWSHPQGMPEERLRQTLASLVDET